MILILTSANNFMSDRAAWASPNRLNENTNKAIALLESLPRKDKKRVQVISNRI
ncbi:MAG: hypothetical protein ACRC1Z_05025 [Waterburya sp.]